MARVPTVVLATKLFRPARRSAVVARPRLAERLGDVRDHRLTLVSAPAGFGKTTLLAEWVARDEHTAWLSLDEGDDDPERFLAHLGAALAGVGLDPPADPADSAVLVNDLARAAHERPNEHRVLVLDDYHVIRAPAVHEAVAFLLEHAPEQLHLVVATRADPPFPLARLRARGLLAEVRAADLRFTSAEAAAFLTDVMGLELAAGDVAALEARTEGWIAGLQLAALSLRDIPDPAQASAFVADLSGSHRFVLDFLADEVLARQDPGVREFLLRTAVLGRLTGSLCDAVTGGRDGDGALAELDRRNVFLVPLDAHRGWYRYHHLFGDVLRARLHAERPAEVPALHRAASDWCAAHDLPEEAVRHALAAGDDARAGFLVESAVPAMRRGRRDTVLLAWMRALPDAVVRRSPVLATTSAWSLLMAGDLDGCGRRLDDAEAALASGDPAGWADTEDLRTAPATVEVYRAALAQARGDVDGTVRHARAAWDRAGPDDHVVRGAAGGFLGLAAWAAGDVESALATFSAAVRSLHAAGNAVDARDATIVLADMWVTAGRPHRARRLLEEALAGATRDGPPFPRAVPDLHVGLAELDREQDDLAGAEEHLATARTLAERGSITENRHRAFVVAAHVRSARGDHAAALRLLDEAAALHRPGFYPDVRPIRAQQARVRLRAGDLAGADERARPVGFLGEYENLTLVRLLLARGRGEEALALLERLQADAEPARAGSLLEIGALRALALDARGDHPGALAELARALDATPEPDAWVRLFLDEGAPLRALRDEVTGAAPARDRGGLADPLSARELEVLRLLDTELTGPEIARRLYVSVNTLRTHTKRIFTKLDVGTRAAALRRARERGLL